MAYSPSNFNPLKEINTDSFSYFDDEYDPEKPNSYSLVCEKREKEEEEQSRVYLVKQQLAESEKHMIEERKKLEEEIRQGKIFNNVSSIGIGRGSAMTLPAWMTEGNIPSFNK